jgi:hypothetical protein
MLPRIFEVARVGGLVATAFFVGGASTEVAVRTHAAIEHARADREVGAAGQLVCLEVKNADGEVVARPKVIAPSGKAAEVVLHDPGQADTIRLAFRVEAVREASGEIALDYALWVPGRDVKAQGRVSLTPGVEHAIELDGGTLVATWLAVPVPSAAFDAFLESEGARRTIVTAS